MPVRKPPTTIAAAAATAPRSQSRRVSLRRRGGVVSSASLRISAALTSGGGTAGGPRLARLAERALTARAAGQVSLERRALAGLEHIQRVGCDLIVERLVAHAAHRFIISRSRSSPSRIRVFTVPSGRLIRSAISVWVSPP